MEQCWACGKIFATSQGRKAHQKTCKQYRAHRAQRAALGTPRLRQPLPQADKIDSTPPSRSPQTAMSQPPDPFTTTLDLLKKNGAVSSGTDSTSKTPAQQRRALLQQAKTTVIDQYWCTPFPITPQMKVDARSHIDRMLRTEPLEEWPLSEILELAACLRDRIYTAAHRKTENAAQRTLEKHKRDVDDLKSQTERTKRKEQWIAEALDKLSTQIRVHSIPPLIALQAICDIKAELGMTLTGDESLPDAHAAIDAVVHSRVADWKLDQEMREKRKQERWIEGATAMGLLIGFFFLYVYFPHIFKHLFDIVFSTSQEAASKSSPQHSSAPPSGESAMPSDLRSSSPYDNPEEYSYP